MTSKQTEEAPTATSTMAGQRINCFFAWIEEHPAFSAALSQLIVGCIILTAGILAYMSVTLEIRSGISEVRREVASGVLADVRRTLSIFDAATFAEDTFVAGFCNTPGFDWQFTERNIDRVGRLPPAVAERVFKAYYEFDVISSGFRADGVCEEVPTDLFLFADYADFIAEAEAELVAISALLEATIETQEYSDTELASLGQSAYEGYLPQAKWRSQQ